MFPKPYLPSLIITLLILVSYSLGFSHTADITRLAQISAIRFELDHQSSQVEQLDSATVTVVISLPIVEHSDATPTPIPNEIYPAPGTAFASTPGTPTPTPIPEQTGAFNLPIILGALGIMLVIILAWFFIGFLPSRNKGSTP